MRQIKVLVVDDSMVFRELLARGINADPALTVVATAGDPYEARDAVLKYRPDVMTLDVEMPRMNGIEFLRRLMPQFPVRTVVISSIGKSVFDAMEAGAVDFVSKPRTESTEQIYSFIEKELNTKIKIASTARVGYYKSMRPVAKVMNKLSTGYSKDIIAIGASTGGTEAIATIIQGFHKDIPGTVIVQHMPPGFTAMYADHLNNRCEVYVKEARTGDVVERGKVLLAPGNCHMRVIKVDNEYRVECKPGEKVSGHCPSVDVLLQSVAKTAGSRAIGVLLTGMGADGAKGLLQMKNSGATTIGQDEASCVVYGMPKVAHEIGAVSYQVSLENVSGKIYSILNSSKEDVKR